MSLINTRIQNLRANANLDRYEYRASRYGGLNLFLAETDNPVGIITPELKEKAFGAIGSTLEVPVIDYDGGVTIGSTRSVTISDDLNTSQMVSLSFSTYSWGFTTVPARHHNNEIALQVDWETSFWKYLYKFAETLDTAVIASLNANKTQVINDKLGLYTEAANTLIATYAQREAILGDIEPIMAANDFYSQMHVLGNNGLMSLIKKMAEGGLYNAENKQMQYSDKILHFSNRVTNPEGRYAAGYILDQGSVGLLFRFEREALNRTKARTGHEWGITTLPLIGVPCGTYYYDSVGDYHAIDGAATADMTRVRKEHYGFSVDVAIVTSYNSSASTIPSPVLKFTINTAATDADSAAPTVSSVSGVTGLTALTVNFSEAMCSDQAGTLITGDVKSYFTSPATGSTTCVITSATAASDGKSVVFIMVAGDAAATDTIDTAVALYDANANALAGGTSAAKVNAGGTAWETV